MHLEKKNATKLKQAFSLRSCRPLNLLQFCIIDVCDIWLIFLFTLFAQNAQAFLWMNPRMYVILNHRRSFVPRIVLWSFDAIQSYPILLCPIPRQVTKCDAAHYLILVDHNDYDGGLWNDQLANRLLQFHGVDILWKCHVSVASDALHKTWRAETI